MNKLHPGVRWVFRIQSYFSIGLILMIIVFYSFRIFSAFSASSLSTKIIIGAIIFIILLILITEIYVRMAYNRWLYEFTKSGVKIERGIIWKRYSNIPYQRIQNVDIRRGIIARLLGFSTLEIQTAGYAASYGRRGLPRSEGHIPGVSIKMAEKIRDDLMNKISNHKTNTGGV
jgi:membrane protein YdbS with pleckstrin-like domain